MATEILKCRLCGSASLSVVLDYGMMPPAGGFAPLGDPRLKILEPLSLIKCNKCSLMQTGQSIDANSIFRNYSYQSSVSGDLRRHFRDLADHLFYMWHLNNSIVVDIGCNDGILINPLNKLGCTAVGIDPSDIALLASVEYGFDLINSYMNVDTAKKFVAKYGKAKMINASNVLAHTDDIHAFMEGVRIMIDESQGLFTVEVHYQVDLIDKLQFDTVYHEHTCYYNLATLIRLFNDHDLSIWHFERTNIHAGSIRVYACHKNRRQQIHPIVEDQVKDEHKWMSSLAFRLNAIRSKDTIHSVLSHLSRHRVYAYGAAGRSTILLNWCGLDDSIVQLVLDDSTIRAGKCVPGVETSIVESKILEEDQPGYCLITAWNYEKSITRDHSKYQGTWIVPLPHMRFL